MSLKRSIRSAIDHAAAATGLLARRERSLQGRLTILMYHRVLPDTLWKASPLPGLVMPLSCFEAQVSAIAQRFEVTTVSKALNRLRVGARDDKPLLAITFDDGYADNHTHAAPILEAHGLRGTFYLVSEFVGTSAELWFDQAARWFHGCLPGDLATLVNALGSHANWNHHDKPIVRVFLAYLKSLSRTDRRRALAHVASRPMSVPRRDIDFPMSVDDAKDLLRRGHEIGAHTASHPLLTQEKDDSLTHEIAGCKRTIESWLGVPISGLCYPNGDHDARVVSVVRDAGFAHAPTVLAGYNDATTDPFRLHRLDMNSARVLRDGKHDDAMFRAELTMLHPY